jgi:hypothetical protein
MLAKEFAVTTIEMRDVDSSQIHSIGHDPETNTLAIRFYSGWGDKKRVGSLYHYQNFTAEDFEAFKSAESLGKHFGGQIKPFADKYPYTKIEDAAPAAAA